MFNIHSLKISSSLSKKAIFIFQAVFCGSGTIKEIGVLTHRCINAKYINELGNTMGSWGYA